jgi:hypothetical protein
MAVFPVAEPGTIFLNRIESEQLILVRMEKKNEE